MTCVQIGDRQFKVDTWYRPADRRRRSLRRICQSTSQSFRVQSQAQANFAISETWGHDQWLDWVGEEAQP